jgi:iron complex transport system ATP-binding protein
MTLEAREVTVNVGDKTLIERVSVTVLPGEIVAVIGPNGAGKSTLLRALVGDVKPDAGEVYMDGKQLNEWSRRDRARVRGVLAQQSALSFAFSVLEVVLIGRGPHAGRAESPHDYAIAEAALDVCQVAHLAQRTYTTLSGGEKQRVQLARVLTQIWEPVGDHTRYLLLDEPTNNLDLSHQHGTLQVARSFAIQGAAVFAILHDLNLAAQYADRIMVMVDGESLTTGTPHEVITPQTIEAAFGIPVTVMPHPNFNRPLVVAMG